MAWFVYTRVRWKKRNADAAAAIAAALAAEAARAEAAAAAAATKAEKCGSDDGDDDSDCAAAEVVSPEAIAAGNARLAEIEAWLRTLPSHSLVRYHKSSK